MFALGLSLALDLGTIHDSTAYFFITHSLEQKDLALKRAFKTAGEKLLTLRPYTSLSGNGLISLSIQAHVSHTTVRKAVAFLMKFLVTVLDATA